MDHLPIGHLLLIVVIDLVLLEALSLVVAYAAGRASASHGVSLYTLALIVPVVGPLGWYARRLQSRSTDLAVVRTGRVSLPLVAGCAALVLAALAIAVSTWLDWVEGSLATDAGGAWGLDGGWSPADLAVTAVATLGTSVLLLAAAATGLLFSMHGRIAVVAAAVGLAWLAIALDELVLMSAVNAVVGDISDASGGHVDGSLSAGWGLDGSLLAGVLALLGAVALLAVPHRLTPGRSTVPVSDAATSAAYTTSLPSETPRAPQQAVPPSPSAGESTGEWW